jgi:hypothetical protein
MPIQFPSSPTVNQEYTYEGKVWAWDGSSWVGVRQQTGILSSNIWAKQSLLIPKRGFGLNSGYNATTDQRRTAAGTIPMLKHNMERNLGLFLNVVGSGWTPANITTALWLDAADSSTITIATGVSTWADKSGNVANATQASTTLQPSYSGTAFPGSLPGVLFDGANDIMDISTIAMRNQTHGVYWVFSRSGAGTGDGYSPMIGVRASAGTGTDRGALHYVKNGNNLGACYPYYQGPGTGNYDLSAGTVYSNSTGNVMSFQSNTTGWGVWRNGTIESTTSTISTPNTDNIGYSIGGQYTQPRRMNGVIGELIMVQTTDTTTRQKIEGYLAHKWGLTSSLPNDHPYKSTAPTI